MSLRDDAKQKLKEAVEIARKAGIELDLGGMLSEEVWYAREKGEDFYAADCVICNKDHGFTLEVELSPTNSGQSYITLNTYYYFKTWSFGTRLRYWWRLTKELLRGRYHHSDDILLSNEDLRKLGDFIERSKRPRP